MANYLTRNPGMGSIGSVAPVMQQMAPAEVQAFLQQMMVGADLNRPKLKNADGSISTEVSATLEGPGSSYVNIPTIWNGQRMDIPQAVQAAKASGQQFPAFEPVVPWQPWEPAAQAAALRSMLLGVIRNRTEKGKK